MKKIVFNCGPDGKGDKAVGTFISESGKMYLRVHNLNGAGKIGRPISTDESVEILGECLCEMEFNSPRSVASLISVLRAGLDEMHNQEARNMVKALRNAVERGEPFEIQEQENNSRRYYF